MTLPLEGIKIIDLSMYLPGPLGTQMLADFGAEVIKVEPLTGEWGRWLNPFLGDQGALFYQVNRNKKSLTLNLKSETGKEIFTHLVQESDVLVEQFRPGVMDKLGLGYEDLSKINPRLIYCSVTGYGHTGPFKYVAGHDLNYLSTAGITGLNGDADKPVMSGVQTADIGGGSLHAVIAILLALMARNITGRGQFCDVAMLDGAISFLPYCLGEWSSGTLPKRGKEVLNGGYACYRLYRTADGGYVSLGAVEEKFWQGFCEKLGYPQYVECQWETSKQPEIIAAIEARMETRTRQEWVDFFAEDDICFAPVLDLEEMSQHPQVKAREMIMTIENFKQTGKDLRVIGSPIKLSDTPAAVKNEFAEIGQHTEEILQQLGYSRDAITRLREEKVIK
jgi:crotonobetainyl-CoA:carnitine CoA-transferase CaiB-like acyl-CoA transferase